MSAIENVSRRGFLKGLAAAGGLVLAIRYFPEVIEFQWSAIGTGK